MSRGSFPVVLSAVVALAVVGAGSASADAVQRLVIVGGGDRPPEAMARFVAWAGGASARILVQRENRLFGLVLKHPGERGVGIDEDTALLVTDGRYAEVVGRGPVVLVDAIGQDRLQITLMRVGGRMDLRTRAIPMHPSDPPVEWGSRGSWPFRNPRW